VSKFGSEDTRNRDEARLRIGEGREFQSLGAATEKAREISCFVFKKSLIIKMIIIHNNCKHNLHKAHKHNNLDLLESITKKFLYRNSTYQWNSKLDAQYTNKKEM